MWKTTLFDGKELGIGAPFVFTELQSVSLPRMKMNGDVVLDDNSLRCKLISTGYCRKGGHSTLEEHIRVQGDEKSLVLLKKSTYEEIDIRVEAFVHWLAHKRMASIGLGYRVPPVIDIILDTPDDEVVFTVGEYTDSKVCSLFLYESNQFQKDFLQILAQLAILVQILEDLLSLDHRDLKADNILITQEPSVLSYSLNHPVTGKKKYTLKSPFSVCIVDFGYACLGDITGKTQVDAGENTFPPLDPCPKDGRDLFHFIVSLYGVTVLRNKIPPALLDQFQTWMKVDGKSLEPSVRKWSYSQWLFLKTSGEEFQHPTCTPRAILEKIREIDSSLFIVS